MQGSEFNIETIEILNPEGNLNCPLPEALQSRDQLIKLYQIMVLTRVFDRAAINLQRTGKMGTYPSNEGQEAIGTGIGFAMQDDDVFVPYYRDVATQIQRGVLLEEILIYWGGDERGQNYQHQSQDFPVCVPIATQSCHATGIAYAIKYQKQERAVVTTCGDGATSKGDFYESINIAGAMGLPVVFVVNNNRWAISVPLAKQTAAQTIAQKAFAAGIDCIRVDGNDPISVFQVVNQALERARQEYRPMLVEALSYRLCDHTTADDASRYRDQREFDEARELEPLIRFKRLLQNDYEWSDEDDTALFADSDAQVKKAIEVYLATSNQPPGEFFDYMFAEPTRELKRQKKAFLDEAKRRG
jgi:2-oxoisovalerate dehydrogenase E1 component alpha subunit